MIIRVITETRNLKTQPFVPKDDQITTGKAWEEWLEEIVRELRYFGISDPADKKYALIIYGGKEIARLEKILPNPSGELDEYDKLKTKLNNYFTPKRNKHHDRYLFLKLRPDHGETVAAYASWLREKANECEFEENTDERILEHLMQTIHNRALIQKAINKKWDLAYGKWCKRCRKNNHFAVVCRSSKSDTSKVSGSKTDTSEGGWSKRLDTPSGGWRKQAKFMNINNMVINGKDGRLRKPPTKQEILKQAQMTNFSAKQ